MTTALPFCAPFPRAREGGASVSCFDPAAPAVSYRDGSSQRPLATSAGGVSGVCSLSNFRLARSTLYPLARVAAEGAAISVWAIGDGIAGGAGGELPGRLEPAAARDISGRGLRRVFALKFQAGEIDSLSLGAGGSRGCGDFCLGDR